MSKQNGLFVAGLGFGVAATVIMSNRQIRTRLQRAVMNTPFGKTVHNRSKVITHRVCEALSDVEGTLRKGEQTIGEVRNQVKRKIDHTATVAKRVVDKVADTSKGAAHKAGDRLERTGRRFQAV